MTIPTIDMIDLPQGLVPGQRFRIKEKMGYYGGQTFEAGHIVTFLGYHLKYWERHYAIDGPANERWAYFQFDGDDHKQRYIMDQDLGEEVK